ncbi:hypothetical protein M2351_008255 [Azospirillum canadense]|nr:hypothetical protein [Azospirillum canadense]
MTAEQPPYVRVIDGQVQVVQWSLNHRETKPTVIPDPVGLARDPLNAHFEATAGERALVVADHNEVLGQPAQPVMLGG